MNRTLTNLSDVSFWFFVSFGLLHLSLSFLVVQNVIKPLSWLLFNTLDLPFLMAALVYGSSRLMISMDESFEKSEFLKQLCAFLAIVIFISAVILNFAVADGSF